MKTRSFALLASAVLMMFSGAARADVVALNGAGATFPYPIYSKWFFEYYRLHPDVEINYQSIGSGGGIRQLLDKTIDFGASDAPMTDAQLAKSEVPILHIPSVLGAIVPTYNVPGLTRELRFSGDVLADIFIGKITKWDDVRIVADNPGVTLPSSHILVVYRSDGSGTTAVFTDYLSKVSPEFKTKVGQGTSVRWPTGLGGKGNEGVTGQVKNTPGAIGYVELVYAESNKLQVGQVKNKAGAFVDASVRSVTAAAAASAKAMPDDLRASITDADGKESYPISTFTYFLVYTRMPAENAKVFADFLKWAVTDGQQFAGKLSYAPLPDALIPRIKSRIQEIKGQ